MSRSRHSSIAYLGSPRECSANSRIRLPVKSLMGEIDAKASAKPSVLNQSKLAFCSSMRLGTSRTWGIFPNENRSRFDLAFVALGELGTGSGELLGAGFGAVVFAITLFLCGLIFN